MKENVYGLKMGDWAKLLILSMFSVPYWSNDYFVEEIVMKVLSCREAHPFDGQGRDETKYNPHTTEDAEHGDVASLSQ